MSTRAIYTFVGNSEEHHVYLHHDGYPSGAFLAIQNAMSLAWPMPGFEANEFAAAFVAANKTAPGSVRLANTRHYASDTAYGYRIYQDAEAGLCVQCCRTHYWDGEEKERQLFDGPLATFGTRAEELDYA
jgi:hypothetical protein